MRTKPDNRAAPKPQGLRIIVSDPFFQSIAATLDGQDAKKAATSGSAVTNLSWAKALIPNLGRIAKRFSEECQALRIRTEVVIGETTVRFALVYASGEKRALLVGTDASEFNRLSFIEVIPVAGEADQTAKDLNLYDGQTWSDDIYEDRLRDMIASFVAAAEAFGGAR